MVNFQIDGRIDMNERVGMMKNTTIDRLQQRMGSPKAQQLLDKFVNEEKISKEDAIFLRDKIKTANYQINNSIINADANSIVSELDVYIKTAPAIVNEKAASKNDEAAEYGLPETNQVTVSQVIMVKNTKIEIPAEVSRLFNVKKFDDPAEKADAIIKLSPKSDMAADMIMRQPFFMTSQVLPKPIDIFVAVYISDGEPHMQTYTGREGNNFLPVIDSIGEIIRHYGIISKSQIQKALTQPVIISPSDKRSVEELKNQGNHTQNLFEQIKYYKLAIEKIGYLDKPSIEDYKQGGYANFNIAYNIFEAGFADPCLIGYVDNSTVLLKKAYAAKPDVELQKDIRENDELRQKIANQIERGR